jgi:DNA-directed RNA polymerase specialized sigma subunit
MSEAAEVYSALDWVLEKIAAAKQPKAPPQLKAVKIETKVKKEPDRIGELDLFHTWNNNGRKPEHLEPLLKSFQPLIQKRINIYKNRVEIPTSAIEMEHKKAFVKALETYKPDKGTQLHSWVTTNLKQVGRYVGERQNFARITENITRHIGSFNAVKAELNEQLGYEPSAQDIHDHIIEMAHPKLAKLSLKDIKRLNEEQRGNLIDKGHDLLGGSTDFSTREEEVIHLIVPQLTKEERKVHELTFGLNGNKTHAPGAIAKKLNMDNSKVSKLRTSIYKKMKPHLDVE